MAPLLAQSPFMDELSKPHNAIVLYALPATAALALHAAVQLREPRGDHALFASLITSAAVGHYVKSAWHVSTAQAIPIVAMMAAVFAITISISMAVYRLFFHPLRHIPGPVSCKLTMWSWVFTDWNGTRAKQIRQMHQKYGDVVRIGPREVSCANAAALPAIYGPIGPAAKVIRGPWYLAQSPPGVHSLQNEPTLPEHNRRRRDWDPAFSIRALGTYKEGLQRNADGLLAQIGRLASMGIVDIRECMMWFGFDVMGELGFGRSFGTIENGKTSEEVHLVELGVRVINTMGNVPYIGNIIRLLPSPLAKFEDWVDRALDWRIQRAGDKDFVAADVFAYLLGEEGKQRRRLNKPELAQDSMLMVVAGSDTTSNAMTFTLYELARQPALLKRVRDELANIFPNKPSRPDDFDLLRDRAELLNACINEALRLWAPVPSGLQRTTTMPMTIPSDNGANIVLPSNTVVSTHTYTLHLDERNFYKPEKFIPDRWLSTDETSSKTHNAKALSPFGYGVTGCIGKNLAFMEMRIVLAQFIMRFDFEISSTDDEAFRNSVRDQFVISTGAMRLKVTERGA